MTVAKATITKFTRISTLMSFKSVPSGLYELTGRVPLHFYWKDNGADTLLVTFSGAVNQSIASVPIFTGQNLTAHLDADILMLSDPSLAMNAKLTLGWYMGNFKQPNLPDLIREIIKVFAGNRPVVLFGASGGGYAALFYANSLKNSTAIAVNPQTDLSQYPYFNTYINEAWASRTAIESDSKIQSEVLTKYSTKSDTRVIYVQNTGDHDHVEKHCVPFFDSLHPKNKAYLKWCELGEGHLAPDRESLMRILNHTINEASWSSLLKKLENEVLTRKTTNLPTSQWRKLRTHSRNIPRILKTRKKA